jgi:predicted dehydrogenase
MNRRNFIEKTSKISLAAGSWAISPDVFSKNLVKKSANEKIVFGAIGVNSMGNGIMNLVINQPNTECAAICDVDANVANKRAEEVFKKTGKRPEIFSDYRKMLEMKDLDAVNIGTPDHWHCLPMVDACAAGKDVYVEKPIGNSIAECNVMVEAARKYGRIVQVGQQQRSGEHWQQAIKMIQTGGIGKLRKVNVWGNFNYAVGQKKVPDEAVPAGLDFDSWLGPAPLRTYNKTRHHGSWRFFWDYGGGLITDWGAHLIDVALWAKNIKLAPISCSAIGGNFASADYNHETFDTMSVQYQLPDYNFTFEHTAGTEKGPYGRHYGLAFIGNDATLVIDRAGWEVFPETENNIYKIPAIPPRRNGRENHEEHVKNWLECIRDKKEPNCTIENGRLVALYAHLGNISLRTNTRVEFDEISQTFGKNEAANKLIMPNYRKPWIFPKV